MFSVRCEALEKIDDLKISNFTRLVKEIRQSQRGWKNSWRFKCTITCEKMEKLMTAFRLHSERKRPICYTLRTFPNLLCRLMFRDSSVENVSSHRIYDLVPNLDKFGDILFYRVHTGSGIQISVEVGTFCRGQQNRILLSTPAFPSKTDF
jgi:hypothetical protein